MRPVRRGDSPQPHDFDDYRDAFVPLMARLGPYCSYCERRVPTQLAVEHIQPKGHPKYKALEGRWENFLLACVNCNATKSDNDVVLAEYLLPDRDNTATAFEYKADGTMDVAAVVAKAIAPIARASLGLVGLDKRISEARDENGKLIAVDRVAQRMEAWATAEAAKGDVDGNPGVLAVRRLAVVVAEKSGFFGVWMSVFRGDMDMRRRLIEAFAGTRASGCFDDRTTVPVSPAPNPDGLPSGGKL